MSESAPGTVVSIAGVAVRYGRNLALDNVSFEVSRGSVFALLGRNGAGKTSLIRCLLGHQRASAGRIRVLGLDAWAGRAQVMARVGVVPEEPDAPPHMTVRELVTVCRALHGRWDGAWVAALLERNGVPWDVAFGSLSKGQKGSLMLALALAHGPELLVLDDPTLGLDVVARRELYDEIIGALADRGTTVLITSHDIDGIERLADRVAILKEGQLAVDEPLERLKGRFRRVRVTATSAGSIGDWQPFQVIRSSRHDWGCEAVVCNFSDEALSAFQARCADAEVLSLSLEEILLTLVGEKGAR